mgnify:FL=1
MENAAEALKMAFGVLMLVLALTLCISSFSQAREAVDSIITIKDRETSYTYLASADDSTRIVGIETVVPTMYKAYKENFEVHFLKADGTDLVLYKYQDQNGNKRDISIIDLESEEHADSQRAINRLDYILSGTEKGPNDPAKKEVASITGGTSGLYQYFKNRKFEERMGEYYQEDKEGKTTDENGATILDINKSKKRVITYILQN